jgi:hypothetical protein
MRYGRWDASWLPSSECFATTERSAHPFSSSSRRPRPGRGRSRPGGHAASGHSPGGLPLSEDAHRVVSDSCDVTRRARFTDWAMEAAAACLPTEAVSVMRTSLSVTSACPISRPLSPKAHGEHANHLRDVPDLPDRIRMQGDADLSPDRLPARLRRLDRAGPSALCALPWDDKCW